MIEFIFLILFICVSVAQIIAVAKENQKLNFYTKPLLMPLLALYYAFGSLALNSFNWLIVVALLFGCGGDIFLMLEGKESYFLIGMVSFLLGHVFYIIAFLMSMGTNYLLGAITLPILIIPVIIILGWAFPKFKDGLGDMKIPVFVYMGAIVFMHVTAILRVTYYGLLCTRFFSVYLGSILFILSDSILAIGEFSERKISHIRVYTMSTYILGQFLIALGMIRI